jgi:hypothetical protein
MPHVSRESNLRNVYKSHLSVKRAVTRRDQPTAVHVPSGLRQALPRATSGRPSI